MELEPIKDLIDYAPKKVLKQILLNTDPRDLSIVCATNSKVAKVCRSLKFRKLYNEKYPEYEINVDDAFTSPTRVGAGAEGEVFIVKKGSPKQEYAMKVIHTRGRKDSYVRNVWRTLKNHASLAHPNIIKYIRTTGPDFHGDINVYMEKCDTDLITYSMGKTLTETGALNIIRQIAEGLKYLHDKGYIHRDIKGENIMLCNGNWKLIDFGFLEKFDKPHELRGTLDFLAPEVVDNKPDVGKPSDVWSLGITLYELYFGQVPFMMTTKTGTLLSILNDPIPFYKENRPISPKLKKLLEGMLMKDPKNRWTVDQVLNFIK
ncbi:MAG TPA: serine/threonine-protein kinase [Saprospiraceae bacterium]|nr:serine/threonine-protein kinase [Saprospiraceae bacterium]